MIKPCEHFGSCGGCTLQNLSPDEYRAGKRQSVADALARAGFTSKDLGDVTVELPLLVPERSRRRAVFKLAKSRDGVEVGFHAAKSHAIIDMRECLVLTPALRSLTDTLRAAMTPLMQPGERCELHATEAENGLDLTLRWERRPTPALTTVLARAFAGKGIARVTFNKDVLMEEAAPFITLGGARVMLPRQAFLQATREGEAALQSHVLALTEGARNIADLFAGLGTFTLAMARHARVHAVEQDGPALAALAAAARATSGLKPVTTEQRDLFKQPMTAPELKAFDAVVLDPPRAGAQAQMAELSASRLKRLAYVSCDAATFARDAGLLARGGWRCGDVVPIDQFLYSGHIELVAGFER